MLPPIDVPASAAVGSNPTPDKQIALAGSTNNAVIYTVPDSRVFRGWGSNAGSQQGDYYRSYLTANGVDVEHYSGFSSGPQQYKTGTDSPQITLLAGTSVKNVGGSYNTYVFGVESDV